MPLLTLNRGSLAFGHIPLLDNVDLQVDKGERIVIIGRNGSGKTSLLAALAGAIRLDDGVIWREPGLRIGYVAQEPVFDPEHTVYHAVISGMGETSALLDEYHALTHLLAQSAEEFPTLLEKLHDLQQKLEMRGAWNSANLAERVIERFSLDPEAAVGTLSGGQKKRLALAQALAESPDLLLLDEPTNHLDIDAITWLENFLLEYTATLVLITHDRSFLDRLATRIVELDRGKLTSFPGRFSQYQQVKNKMLADEAQQQAHFDKFLAQEEVWIRKGVEARRTRNEGRVLRLERLRRERAERRNRLGQVEFALHRGDEGARLVAELSEVNKSFTAGDGQIRTVIADFSCRLMRGDRVGLIGPNGAGKTTVLRLILGELAPDSGQVRRGERLQIAYFDQFRTRLDDEATLVDIISPGSDTLVIGERRRHVIGYLEDFLFPPQRARAKVGSLSGGERNRLLLARLFAQPANVLVLDEPTNDLDIDTLELLEQLLQDYEGTILLVSHDRTFLDNVVTQTLVWQGDGRWIEHAGGYSDWSARAEAKTPTTERLPRPSGEKPVAAEPARTTRPRKLSFNETRELENLPSRIEALETEQKSLTGQLQDPASYGGSPRDAHLIAERIGEIEGELLVLLERWEDLEGKR